MPDSKYRQDLFLRFCVETGLFCFLKTIDREKKECYNLSVLVLIIQLIHIIHLEKGGIICFKLICAAGKARSISS